MAELLEPPVGSVVAAGRTVFLREDDDANGAAWRKIGHLTTYGWTDVLEAGDVRVIRHGLAELPEDAIDTECEREDCQRIAATASEVYCEVTGGALSYPTYDARTILARAGEETQDLVDEEFARVRAEAVADERQRIVALIDAARARAQRGDPMTDNTELILLRRIVAAGSVPVATPEPAVQAVNCEVECGKPSDQTCAQWGCGCSRLTGQETEHG